MRLTAEQRLAAEMGLDVDKPLGRGSIRNRKWPGGVMAYVIDSSLSGDSRAMSAIRAGMQEWTSKTCIRFKERTNEAAYANFKLGGGCSSYVGRTGRKQDINLARGCWTKGIVAHEIGHALGFYHEQSRPDRDEYVTIMLENIKPGKERNFNKYPKSTIDSLGTDYDYGSVMHYRGTSFSKNGKPTIVAKKPGVTLGQRRGLSPIDAQQGNLLYKGECGGGGGGGPATLPPTTRPTTPGGGGGGGGNCKDVFPYCQSYYCHHKDWAKANCAKTCRMC
ncbi:zinc metalloproteinase nas-14-like [Oculina patagonica]